MEIISGITPPYVFLPIIGKHNVYAGPSLVSPQVIEIYTDPKRWLGLDARSILRIRMQGVGAFRPVNPAKDVSDPSIEKLREIALYTGNVTVELEMKKSRPTMLYDAFAEATYGGGRLERILYYTGGKANRRIEKAYSDRDLKAKEAVLYLESSGINVYKVQQLLSVGALGRERRLVPTRWSITAVDSITSSYYIERIRELKELDSCLLGESYTVGNRIIVMLMPGKFYYEMLESWGPYYGNRDPEVAMDYEGFLGRTTYAEEVEGAYYAARYSVSKYLYSIGRQARTIVLLEVDRNWIPRLGVWRVREGTELALKNLRRFESEDEMIRYALSRTYTSARSWLRSSFALRQMSLERFM
ncbi:MAG: hypothetical protein ACP5GH_00945 [Nitrososphaeria archaeon]